jgi:hypothetical protein
MHYQPVLLGFAKGIAFWKILQNAIRFFFRVEIWIVFELPLFVAVKTNFFYKYNKIIFFLDINIFYFKIKKISKILFNSKNKYTHRQYFNI